MIPAQGSSFNSSYLLVGKDESFALECIELLLSLDIDVIAVIGETAISLKESLGNSRHTDSIQNIIFDSSLRPWNDNNTLQYISDPNVLGINGGIEYLLPEEFLAGRSLINLHPAPLPINRGSHHSFWAIMEGEPMGATLHWISSGLDEGPIIAKVEKKVRPSMTAAEVQKESNQEAIGLLRNNILKVMCGQWSMHEQEGRTTKHFKREIIQASTIEGNLNYSGDYILRLSRAVCNKKNGFFVTTEHGVYKVVIDSVVPK